MRYDRGQREQSHTSYSRRSPSHRDRSSERYRGETSKYRSQSRDRRRSPSSHDRRRSHSSHRRPSKSPARRDSSRRRRSPEDRLSSRRSPPRSRTPQLKRRADPLESERAKVPDVKRTPKKIAGHLPILSRPVGQVSYPIASIEDAESTSPVERITRHAGKTTAAPPMVPDEAEISPASPIEPDSDEINPASPFESESEEISPASPVDHFADSRSEGFQLDEDDVLFAGGLGDPSFEAGGEVPTAAELEAKATHPQFEMWDLDMRSPPIPGISEALLPTAKDMNEAFGDAHEWYSDGVMRAFMWKWAEELFDEYVTVNWFGPNFQRAFYFSSAEIREKAPFPDALSSSSRFALIPMSINYQFRDSEFDGSSHWFTLELDLDEAKATIWNGIASFDKPAIEYSKKFLTAFNESYALTIDLESDIDVVRWGNGDGWSCGIEVLQLFKIYAQSGRPIVSLGQRYPVDAAKFKEENDSLLRVWIRETKDFYDLDDNDLDQEQYDIEAEINRCCAKKGHQNTPDSHPRQTGSGGDSSDGSDHDHDDDSDDDDDDGDDDAEDDYTPPRFGNGIKMHPIQPTALRRQLWVEEDSREPFWDHIACKTITRGEYAQHPTSPRWIRNVLRRVFKRLSCFTEELDELFTNAGVDDGNVKDALNDCFTLVEWEAVKSGSLPKPDEIEDKREATHRLREVLIAAGITNEEWETMLMRKCQSTPPNHMA